MAPFHGAILLVYRTRLNIFAGDCFIPGRRLGGGKVKIPLNAKSAFRMGTRFGVENCQRLKSECTFPDRGFC
jgi:hypothetical protein